MKRVFEREHEGYLHYYDLGRIIRITIYPYTEAEDEVNEGVITFDTGKTENLAREIAVALKDAWIAYLEGTV